MPEMWSLSMCDRQTRVQGTASDLLQVVAHVVGVVFAESTVDQNVVAIVATEQQTVAGAGLEDVELHGV